MASSSTFLSEEHLLCCICLDVFTNPVSTPCGHNFCRKCLAEYWDGCDICKCPVCNKHFEKRPELSVNTFISETAAQFRNLAKSKASGATEKKLHTETKMLCDACTDVKQTSVKSCLNCGASYCETHLQTHKNIKNLKKHKLIDPVENLEDYICQKHERPLELFCRDDKTCVCHFCTETEHKNHKTVPVEEARSELKALLNKTQTEIQEMIQERLQKIAEIKNALELSKISTQDEISDGAEVFTALMSSIERSKAELLKVMEEMQKAAERQADELIKDLEQEITELRRRDTELEQLQQFQIYPSMCHPPHARDWTDISLHTHSSVDILESSFSQLQKTLNNEMAKKRQTLKQRSKQKAEPTGIKKALTAAFKWFIIKRRKILVLLLLFLPLVFLASVPKDVRMEFYTVDVTLDPETANDYLLLSDDGKQVRHIWLRHTEERNDPYKKERFYYMPYVLAKESFSAGKFYFEVQVTGKVAWDIGVAKESVDWLHEFDGCADETWTLVLREESYVACTGASVSPPLSLRENLELVGVFVDYESGLISFYDVKARSHIYSFTGQSFAKKLYPYFSPGDYDTSPLIISNGYRGLTTLRNIFYLL